MGCTLTTEEVEHIDRTIAKLKAENGRLREEFDKMDVWHSKELLAAIDENKKLRELVRDYVNAPCTTCDCWDDNFRCWNYDGADCGLVARARELGVEVDA